MAHDYGRRRHRRRGISRRVGLRNGNLMVLLLLWLCSSGLHGNLLWVTRHHTPMLLLVGGHAIVCGSSLLHLHSVVVRVALMLRGHGFRHLLGVGDGRSFFVIDSDKKGSSERHVLGATRPHINLNVVPRVGVHRDQLDRPNAVEVHTELRFGLGVTGKRLADSDLGARIRIPVAVPILALRDRRHHVRVWHH